MIFDKNMSRCIEPKKKRIKLNSPTGGKPILLPINLDITSDSDSETDDIDNIFKTIRFIGEDNTALPLEDILPEKKMLPTNFEAISNLCNKYNRCINTIRFLEEGTSLSQTRFKNYPSRELCYFIMQQCYRRAVKNPAKLNKYDPFSPEVYGETSFELICLIIDSLNITKDDVFLDLGSGIGQVVLQMAALTPCKLCVGLEKNVIPSLYAENLAAYFREWMSFFGKKYNNVDLIQKDFLSDDSIVHIRNATIIFVNNVSFGPQINHQLTLKFQDLNDGVRIISPVTFCPEKFRITGRSLSNIASIMNIVEIPHLKGPVSWTAKSVAYYIHILDRRKLENFFSECVKKERGLSFIETRKKTYNSEPTTTFSTVFSSNEEYYDETSSEIDETSSTSVSNDQLSQSTVDFDGKNETTLKLNQLLDSYANQFKECIKCWQQESYKSHIKKLVDIEKKRNVKLNETIHELENEINQLENETVRLLQRNITSRYQEIDK